VLQLSLIILKLLMAHFVLLDPPATPHSVTDVSDYCL